MVVRWETAKHEFAGKEIAMQALTDQEIEKSGCQVRKLQSLCCHVRILQCFIGRSGKC